MATVRALCAALVTLGALFCSCNKSKTASKDTLTTRYHHTYGTELKSEQEWIKRGASGLIVRHETNGMEVREQYREGVLDGLTSWTFPHSDRLQRVALYNKGHLLEETFHFSTGAPREKKIYKAGDVTLLTAWYESGSPRSVEEYAGIKLIKGEYFTPKNEPEALLVNSTGIRPIRDSKGVLLAEDSVINGLLVQEKSFYPSGAVEAIIPIINGRLQGVMKTFLENGEPKTVEEWNDGLLHGNTTLFSNGERIAVVPYLYGHKQGTEVRYKTGTNVIEEEISWVDDRRHGPTTSYAGPASRTEWYFSGSKVSPSDIQ